MVSCDYLCTELAKLLGGENVKCFIHPGECTINYRRKEVVDLFKRKGIEKIWGYSYDTGSIFIIEATGIEAGDVVVLIEDEERKIEEIKNIGCHYEYTHRHERFGVSHIHFNCIPVRDVDRLVRLLGR